MNNRIIILTLLAVLLAVPAARSMQSDGAQSNSAFLYGEIATRSGNEYKGFLRWGTEEAFWDDLFHSGKEDLPFLKDRDRDRKRGRDR